MTASVLDSVTLGYEAIWDQWRTRTGVRMHIDSHSRTAIDPPHLLAAITEAWPQAANQLMLSTRNAALLNDFLERLPANGVQLEIQASWLQDSLLAKRVRNASERGVRLVWRGNPGEAPQAEQRAIFFSAVRSLTTQEALAALRAALRQDPPEQNTAVGDLFEGLASQALVEHALDRAGAQAVIGWPSEEILYGYRFQQIQPSRAVMMVVIRTIDADGSLDAIEHQMGNDPVLCYRLMRYLNSAGIGLRSEIHSIKQGLMALGYSRLRAWIMEQMARASSDANLDPVRHGMVWRARIMEHLADAGVEDSLRSEVFLCGIFSQIDLVLGEPLGSAIHRLPLHGRVTSAILGQTGPYAPWLQVATALETCNTRVIREVCNAHGVAPEAVNRALLRTLAQPF